MEFDSLRKAAKVLTPAVMPFTIEVKESTKIMALDNWLNKRLKERDARVGAQAAVHPNWSPDKLEGYEKGLIDMALDVKNELKRLK